MRVKHNVIRVPLTELNCAIENCVNNLKLTPVILGPPSDINRYFFDEDDGEYNDEVVPIDVRSFPLLGFIE